MLYIALYGACLLAGLFLIDLLAAVWRNMAEEWRRDRVRAQERLAREYRKRQAERGLYLSELAARYRGKERSQ